MKKKLNGLLIYKKIISDVGIYHTIIEIKDNEDLWKAVQYIRETNRRVYEHCQTGVNRISMICLIIQIMRLGPESASEVFKLISQTIGHGFDYYKDKYKQVLSDVLIQAKRQGLLFS